MRIRHRIFTRLPAADQAFTLIELAVVMVILGLLVTVAITGFVGMRQRAWRSELVSDVHHVALTIETLAAAGDAYPATWAAVTSAPNGVDVGSLRATGWTYVDGGTSFCVAATHPAISGGAVAVYDRTLGGMQPVVGGDADPSDNC